MRIDKSNLHLLRTAEIYVHDDIYVGMQYDYISNRLVVSLLSEDEEGKKAITFYNVIGYNMTACDFWGRSPHVFCWTSEVDEKYSLLKEINDESKKYISDEFNPSQKIGRGIEYTETMLLMSSGDRLVVVCEYIDYCND